MSTEITKFESIASVVAKNKPVIQERLQKAIAACRLLQVNETDEQDAIINNTLVKCNATLPVVEGLRKEYTSIIDEWKKSEMALEKELKEEMDRLRNLRNERANRLAQSNREKQAAIDKAKNKEIEIARIKKEQVLAVQLGIANRISKGTEAIAKLFNEMTLATFDKAAAQLDTIKPKLKEDLFRGFLAVDYNNEIVSYDEFKAIVDKAYSHFDYPKCDKEYQSAVKAVIAEWRAKLPAKKKELETIAKGGAEAERLAKIAKDRAAYEAAERAKEEEVARLALESKAKEEEQNAALDAEFKGQLASQELVVQDATRGIISYRLAIEDKPLKIVEVMSRIILNVLADPSFKGIHKRDKAGVPKRDAKGNAEYINAIQDWLDLLAKIKPSPEFDGVIKFEDVLTIAKAK